MTSRQWVLTLLAHCPANMEHGCSALRTLHPETEMCFGSTQDLVEALLRKIDFDAKMTSRKETSFAYQIFFLQCWKVACLIECVCEGHFVTFLTLCCWRNRKLQQTRCARSPRSAACVKQAPPAVPALQSAPRDPQTAPQLTSAPLFLVICIRLQPSLTSENDQNPGPLSAGYFTLRFMSMTAMRTCAL